MDSPQDQLANPTMWRGDPPSGGVTPRRLRTEVSWMLPANVVYGLCQCWLLIALNKLGSPSVVGQFGLVLAITAPIFLFADLRLPQLLATDTRTSVPIKSYFLLRGWLLLAALLAVIGGAFFLSTPQITAVLILVALSKSVEATANLCYGVQQRIQRTDRIAISLFLNGMLMASAFTFMYWWKHSLAWGIAGLLVSRLAVLTGYDLPMLRRASRLALFESRNEQTETTPRSSNAQSGDGWICAILPEGAMAIVRHAFPLGITALMLSLTSNLPRYLIVHLQSEHALGIFCSLAGVMQGATLLFRAVEQPASARFARLVQARDRQAFTLLLNRLLALFLVGGLVGCVLSWLWGAEMLSLVFNPAYRIWAPLLALMCVVSTLGHVAGIIESSLIAMRITAIQLPMHACTFGTCLICSLLWIPGYGIYGMVGALICCRIPFIAIGILLLRRRLSEWKPAQHTVTRNTRLPVITPHFDSLRTVRETGLTSE